MIWPEGRGGPMHLSGRSRDIRTLSATEAPVLLDVAGVEARLSSDRNLVSLDLDGAPGRFADWTGMAVTGKFRAALRERYPMDSRQSGEYLLLDDIPGAAFISNWAWHCWEPDETAARWLATADRTSRKMEGVCIGLARGSPALNPHGMPDVSRQSSAYVEDLVNPLDPAAIHALPQWGAVPAVRRARWIDVWRDADDIVAESGYQDSAATPDDRPHRRRRAVHEYRLQARIAPDGILRDIRVTPLVLPYSSCPAAAAKARALIGSPIAALRETVPATLAKEAGCTHLNDVLRALAAVPLLASRIDAKAW